eukprot:g331.t1
MVRNITQETSILVDKCKKSREFSVMFFRHHKDDLKRRIQALTQFMYRAGREKRPEKVLISKQILRLRQLLASLQKDNAMQVQDNIAKSMNQRTEPVGVAPRPFVQEKQIVTQAQEEKILSYKNTDHEGMLVAHAGAKHGKDRHEHQLSQKKLQNDDTSGQSQQRSGPQEILKPHERLFRQRTKSMIIAENIEKRFGKRGKLKSPNDHDKAKRYFESSLRGGRNSNLSEDWRSKSTKPKGKSPQKGNKKPIWNSSQNLSKGVTDIAEVKGPLYSWEEGYDDVGSTSQQAILHASGRINTLRKEASDPKFKMKRHNIAFGSKPTERGAPRFDPKSLYRKVSQAKHVSSSTARLLLDFSIVLNTQEYETYRMLALGVPLEKSALQRQAVKEAAKHATKRLSLTNFPATIDDTDEN